MRFYFIQSKTPESARWCQTWWGDPDAATGRAGVFSRLTLEQAKAGITLAKRNYRQTKFRIVHFEAIGDEDV
jgi:hypothetical protein